MLHDLSFYKDVVGYAKYCVAGAPETHHLRGEVADHNRVGETTGEQPPPATMTIGDTVRIIIHASCELKRAYGFAMSRTKCYLNDRYYYARCLVAGPRAGSHPTEDAAGEHAAAGQAAQHAAPACAAVSGRCVWHPLVRLPFREGARGRQQSASTSQHSRFHDES